MKQLDDLDHRIISELEADARISLQDLARKLGCPNSTIRDRVRKLEEEEIILGYTTRLNYLKLGYGIKAIVLVTRDAAGYLDSTLQDLAKVHEVTKIQYVTGQVDEILTLYVQSIDHLKDILFTKFSTFSGSSHFNTLIVLQENTFPFALNLSYSSQQNFTDPLSTKEEVHG